MQNWLSTRSAKKGWRSILQSLPDDLFATDLQGRIKFVSQRMIDLSSVDGTLQCIRSQAGISFDPQFVKSSSGYRNRRRAGEIKPRDVPYCA